MELVENGFLFNSLGQVTNRLVFMVAEALLFKTCERCFAGAYDVTDFFGSSHWGDITGPYLRPELGKTLAVLIIMMVAYVDQQEHRMDRSHEYSSEH